MTLVHSSRKLDRHQRKATTTELLLERIEQHFAAAYIYILHCVVFMLVMMPFHIQTLLQIVFGGFRMHCPDLPGVPSQREALSASFRVRSASQQKNI